MPEHAALSTSLLVKHRKRECEPNLHLLTGVEPQAQHACSERRARNQREGSKNQAGQLQKGASLF